MKHKLIYWLVPAIIGISLTVLVSPALADLVDSTITSPIPNYTVGSEVTGDHQQVYFQDSQHKSFISNPDFNSYQATSSGEYITWTSQINGNGQIFLYHIPSNSLLQLTNTSNNQKPQVSDSGQVVWERWRDDHWEVYFFNKAISQPLAPNTTSINPKIDDDYIVFARKHPSGQWIATVYSISLNQQNDIITGPSVKDLPVSTGKITLPSGEKINLSSAYTSNFSTITPTPTPNTPQTVSNLQISQELDVTPADILQTSTPNSPSETPAPNTTNFDSTPSAQITN